MAKPACGARKPIKNQEGQGMLDIDEMVRPMVAGGAHITDFLLK